MQLTSFVRDPSGEITFTPGKPLELCLTGYQYRPEHLLSRDLCFPMMAGGQNRGEDAPAASAAKKKFLYFNKADIRLFSGSMI